jgi:hypothetical protein
MKRNGRHQKQPPLILDLAVQRFAELLQEGACKHEDRQPAS